jgi:CheY-like chemotaxis protein
METAAAPPPEMAATGPRKRSTRAVRAERTTRRASSSRQTTPVPLHVVPPPNEEGAPPCVLIVDDDAATRLLCAINLKLEGFRVLEAADGRRGLARARFERPDIVLTDVAMPGLDGFQLAEALRLDERTRQIPLVFLSGEATPADAARAQQVGALAYVTKPFDPPALVSLVASLLNRSAANEQRGA